MEDVAEKYFANTLLKSEANSLNINENELTSSSDSNAKHNFLQRFQARVVSEIYFP